jgi:HEAT repeat protein
MYNYHVEIIWSANIALFAVIIATSIAIIASLAYKNYTWRKRRSALHKIKNNVYGTVLAHKAASKAVCEPVVTKLTPEQFIDIETNRVIDAGFFNESEQEFLRGCSLTPDMFSKLEKIATTSRSKWQRIEALLALGYTQADSAADILKNSIRSKDKDITYFSMIALGQIKTAQSAKVLLDYLQKVPSSGYKIVSILENFPKEIADEAIKLTDHYDPLVRFWALALLSKLNLSSHIKQIEKLTQDQDVDVRGAACDCLGSSGDKNASQVLLKSMKDDSWLVRNRAVLAYGRLMGDAAMPEISKLIKDSSWSVADAVRDVMTEHIEASLPYIERFLEGGDEIPKKYSVMALENSGYLAKLLNVAVSDGDKGAAIRILKGVINSRARFGLDAAIGHLKPALRAKAVQVIKNIEEA